jgi:hypothetical protein
MVADEARSNANRDDKNSLFSRTLFFIQKEMGNKKKGKAFVIIQT